MSKLRKWALACLILLVIMLPWGAVRTTGTHMGTSPCVLCHVAKDVTEANALVLNASQEKLCGTCHAQAILVSHPSGFVPKRVLAKEYPLDWKGELTCSSCHKVHGTQAGLMRTSAKGSGFCLSCHDKNFFDAMPDRGASLSNAGHMEARESTPGVDLDPFSLQCMSCHDEQASNNQVGISAQGVMRHVSSSVNHPIGRSYKAAATYGGYRPIDQLPKAVLLPDGKVGCVSCHEGYSKKHGGLVTSNTQTELCLICHDL